MPAISKNLRALLYNGKKNNERPSKGWGLTINIIII